MWQIAEGESVAASASSISIKKILIGAGFAVVLFIVVMGFFLARHSSGASKPAPEKAVLYDMGELTTNLSDASEMKYVKIKTTLRLENSALGKEIEEKGPILRDTLVGLLNAETSADMMNDRPKLKSKAMAVLNQHLMTGKIVDIYFSDLVMQ